MIDSSAFPAETDWELIWLLKSTWNHIWTWKQASQTYKLNDVGDALPVGEFDMVASIHQSLITLRENTRENHRTSSQWLQCAEHLLPHKSGTLWRPQKCPCVLQHEQPHSSLQETTHTMMHFTLKSASKSEIMSLHLCLLQQLQINELEKMSNAIWQHNMQCKFMCKDTKKGSWQKVELK